MLGDQVLWLGRWKACLSGSGGCFECENVLFEKILLDKLFQVFPEGPTVDDLVSLGVMVGSIFSCSENVGSYRICLECLTHGWSLIMLKTSLMGSLNGLKYPPSACRFGANLVKGLGALVS